MSRSIAAQNATLDNDYGTTRGPHTPAVLEVALSGSRELADEISTTTEVDDGLGGTEFVANGYARGTHSSDDWLPAADAAKTTSVPVSFGTPTEAWGTLRYALLLEPGTDAVWDVVKLNETEVTTGAGTPVTALLTVASSGNFEG